MSASLPHRRGNEYGPRPTLGRFAPASPATPAVAILGSTILAIWLLSGVSIDEAVRFVAFEALFVLLPGCLLYALLSPAPPEGWLALLAVGWPCGYAIEVGAFALTAALHVRGSFVLLPLVSAVACGLLLATPRGRSRLGTLRRGFGQRPDRPVGEGRRTASAGPEERTEYLPMAILVSLGLLILALVIFAGSPLPGQGGSVAYYSDNVADISWAAEALNHWPITLPFVAGRPAHYYVATFIHMAAIDQVTGVPLPTVVLRLFPTTMVVVISLQLWSIGRSLGRSRLIAPVAVALFFLVEDFNLDPTRPEAFAVDVFNTLPRSPTYAFGATFFLGLLVLSQRWLTDTDNAPAASPPPPAVGGLRGDRGALGRVLVLCAVLVLGAGASKTSAVAVFLGALGLYWLWRLAVERPTRLPLYVAAVTATGLLAVYRFILSGGYASNLGVHPFTFVHYTVVAPVLLGQSELWPTLGGHPIAWYVLLAVAVPAVSVCAFAPLLGAAWLRWGLWPLSDFARLCIAAFAVSLAAYFILGAPGNSQGYFLAYGYLALVPIAAQGLVSAWLQTPPGARRAVGRACLVLLALGLSLAATTLALAGAGSAVWHAWYVAAYGAVAGAIVFAIVRLQPNFASVFPSRVARVLVCAIPLLGTLGLVKPLAEAFPMVWKTALHRRTSPLDSAAAQGMSAPLYRGLSWVREHTGSCDVIAVNNHYADAAHHSSYYDYYSAFAERRVFLESWYGTPRGELGGKPYPARLALNDLAVLHGSAAALRTLADDGVAYVLIDKTHGGGAVEPAQASRLVFENSALSVYRLRRPGGVEGTRRGCGSVSGI